VQDKISAIANQKHSFPDQLRSSTVHTVSVVATTEFIQLQRLSKLNVG